MHLKRWLTSIIALPILIYAIGFAPRWVFYFILFLVSSAGLTEFHRIAVHFSVCLCSKGFTGCTKFFQHNLNINLFFKVLKLMVS